MKSPSATALDDYGGPFLPDLEFGHFSKPFLLELVKRWQWAWMHLDNAFFTQWMKRCGIDEAYEIEPQAWIRVAKRMNPLYARIARISLANVVDCHKVFQLPLDNTLGALWRTEIRFVDEYESIHSVPHCPALEFLEKHAPDRITKLCELDRKVIERYKVNMEVDLTPRKLAPRKSASEAACTWQLKLDVPEARPRRPIEELVDPTACPPQVDDLSGPLYPNLDHEHFSSRFLLLMMDAWQYAWMSMSEAHFELARNRFDYATAQEMASSAWSVAAPKVQARYRELARVGLNTVLDSLKVWQLGMDGPLHPLLSAAYDVRHEDHVILTVTRREPTLHRDWEAPDLGVAMGQGDWTKRLQATLLNPEIRVRRLGPIPKPDDSKVSARWELTRPRVSGARPL